MAKKKRDGFYKRGRFWWASSDPVTNKPATTKCTNIEAARAWFKERELLANDPQYAASKNATLGKWANKFLELGANKNASTKKHDESKVAAILGVLDESTALASIGPGTFDEYVVKRRKQVNNSRKRPPCDYTIRRELNKLIAILRLAKRSGCYKGDLDALIPGDLEGHYTPRERSLTESELAAFLSNLPTTRWRALAAVCVAVGCRLSEARKLEPSDIDLDLGLVHLRGTKTKKSDRELPVISAYRLLLEAAMPFLPIGPITNIDRTFAIACRKSGIADCSPNDLRRTHSTLLGERGIHDDALARLLGHETVTLAKRTYNRARAIELRPMIESQLLQAKPIVIPVDSLQLDDSKTKKGFKTSE